MYKFLCRALCITLISVLAGCGSGAPKQTNSTAAVTFAFAKGALVSAKTARTAKAALATTVAPTPKYVLVSATDANGNAILNGYKAEIYSLNTSYITAPIPLAAGSYRLTSFLVLDSNDNVIYLVPTESATADIKALVSTLLPMSFQINGSQPNAVSVDVLAPDSSPADFGYPVFSFNPVSYVSFRSEVQAQGVDTVADMTVNGVHYSHPAANTLLRVAEAGSYTLVFSKAGYYSQTFTLSAADLANYQNVPLMVSLVPIPVTAVVTFDTAGGSAIVPLTVNIGSHITLPADPIKPGYLFDGWYLDAELQNILPADYVVTGNTTLHAKWNLNPAQYLAWTGTGSIMIDGELRTSPYLLPLGRTTMAIAISGAAGGNSTTAGAPGETRTFTAVPIIAGTYTITLGAVGQNGQGPLNTGGPISGAGGGGASSIKISGNYVAGAAGGDGGGTETMSAHSSPSDAPGGLGGSGDGAGSNGQDADGYLGWNEWGGAGGVVNTGGAAVGGTVTGTNSGAGTIVITTTP